ncbi:hypothetical protein BKA67DRAFT_653694 [Truncatella angustata]|uniref:Uncharacterized protein n=1 Tax=Truncatella angustata TaxID=152316 RepID=A0A9P8UXT8_9PEZI|nr:uncharacterized protein BKA67DRAFT_653694 [Truncatella angustata]KAH6660521.1 hypothetical protein BKA67DRAFT_653694 [Truncatella angustata]
MTLDSETLPMKSSMLDASDHPRSPQLGHLGGDQLPGYEEKPDDVEDQKIGPIDLVFSNHHVVAVSASDHGLQPLYELNRGMATLSNSTTTVTFSRLDHAVRETAAGDPRVRERKRRLYDMEHTKGSLFAKYALKQTHLRGHDASMFKDVPPFWCKNVSRTTVGDVGLRIDTKIFSRKVDFKA